MRLYKNMLTKMVKVENLKSWSETFFLQLLVIHLSRASLAILLPSSIDLKKAWYQKITQRQGRVNIANKCRQTTRKQVLVEATVVQPLWRWPRKWQKRHWLIHKASKLNSKACICSWSVHENKLMIQSLSSYAQYLNCSLTKRSLNLWD